MVFSQIVVHQMAVAFVEHQFFGQRHADAKGHAAQTLRARCLGVQDATGGEAAVHPAHARLAGDAVHTDLGKEGTEGSLATVGLGVTLLDRALDRKRAILGEFRQIGATVVGGGDTILQGQVAFLYAHSLGDLFAQGFAGDKNRPARGCGTPAATGSGGFGQAAVAQTHGHTVRRNAQHFARNLGEDRIGARADVGHVGFNQQATVLVQRHAGVAFAQHIDASGRGHAVADQPFTVRLADLAAVPAKGLGPIIQRLGQFVGRECAPV